MWLFMLSHAISHPQCEPCTSSAVHDRIKAISYRGFRVAWLQVFLSPLLKFDVEETLPVSFSQRTFWAAGRAAGPQLQEGTRAAFVTSVVPCSGLHWVLPGAFWKLVDVV